MTTSNNTNTTPITNKTNKAIPIKIPIKKTTFYKLAHHNIFFGDPADYGREFDDIFHRHLPPNDPTLYVCITSKTDPDHAPIGCENWFVLANMPYLGPNFDWQTQGAAYIEKFKIENLKLKMHHPQFSILNSQFSIFKTMTPQWLQNTYGGNCGAIYGFSSNSRTAEPRCQIGCLLDHRNLIVIYIRVSSP